MFRNAYQRDWAIVGAVCLVATFLMVSTLGFSSARMNAGMFAAPINEVEPCLEGQECALPDCPLPTPAPACTAGQTICTEGPGNCHAAVYTCAGTPGAWGTSTTCTYNACTGNPGSVGSKCQ